MVNPWAETRSDTSVTRTWNTTSASSNPTMVRCKKTIYTHAYDTSDFQRPYIQSQREEEEEIKKVKELIKKQKVLKMKKTWNKEIIEHPIKPSRPASQLRGVCFSGRGWA